MAFRVGDTIVVVGAGLSTAEREALVPGKGSTTSQFIICNPHIAACQRACGLNPATDTTVFGSAGYNIIPFGSARLCDIFDSDATFNSCLMTEYNWCVGEGADFSFSQDNVGYGTYICPPSGFYVTDAGGTDLTFNTTSVHYTLTVGLGAITCSEYTTNYSKRLDMDLGTSAPHSFSTSSTNLNVMVVF